VKRQRRPAKRKRSTRLRKREAKQTAATKLACEKENNERLADNILDLVGSCRNILFALSFICSYSMAHQVHSA